MLAPDERSSLGSAGEGTLARLIASSPPGQAAEAEAELYRRFAPRVRLFGLKHLRDETAARDLAQEALLVTIERLRAGEVREPDQIASFVLGTSRLLVQAQQRTERRRAELRAEYAHLMPSSVDPPAVASGRVPIEDCLRALGERERTVLVLTFYIEHPADTIAKTLGMSAGAVRVARHRALARMRECLKGRGLG